MTNEAVDVVVVGGGAAGLSAAVMLGRSQRSVLVIDAGRPRNARADGVHGFLTQDGTPPGELLARGRAEVEHYGGIIRSGTALAARPITLATGPGFEIELAEATTVTARRLLVATGLTDELPDLPGLAEQWGRGVVHCPYCHGWEVRDQAIGVIAFGSMAAHQALLFRQLSSDLILFTHTAPTLSPEQRADLAARKIEIVDGEVAAIETVDGQVSSVRLVNGESIARQAVAVGVPAVARSAVLDSLGIARRDHPMGAELGSTYVAEPTGATSVPGLWIAGNVAEIQTQVITAAAAGAAVGAQINFDLVSEDVRLAQ